MRNAQLMLEKEEAQRQSREAMATLEGKAAELAGAQRELEEEREASESGLEAIFAKQLTNQIAFRPCRSSRMSSSFFPALN